MFSIMKDVVVGTFTHSTEYLEALEKSIKKYYPDIHYILQFDSKSIGENFEELRAKFKQTGKRYWLFLDHDIQFISSDTIPIALSTLIRGNYACVGVYSSYYLNHQAKPEELTEREVGWVPGYFQLVDSRRIGHIAADLTIPYPNQSIDTSYCVSIRAEGYKIGIAPSWVYHQYKPLNLTYYQVIQGTNEYLYKKWGKFYFDTCVYSGCLIGPDPGAEVWHKMTMEEVENEIEDIFQKQLKPNVNCDVGTNMLTLKEFAQQYESITEFGVARGASTIAFAAGKPKKLTSYELYDTMDARIKALLGRGVGWKYHSGADSRKIDIEETDVLFIDTLHTYDQLIVELQRHHMKVKSAILLHDTSTYEINGEIKDSKGLSYAINEFLENHPEWYVEEVYSNDNGLTVLKRKNNL